MNHISDPLRSSLLSYTKCTIRYNKKKKKKKKKKGKPEAIRTGIQYIVKPEAVAATPRINF